MSEATSFPPAQHVFDVEVDVDGVRVTGSVEARHGRYMTVEILTPYTGLVRNFSMPAFLPPIYVGQRAVSDAEKALRDLYRRMRYLNEHRGEIAEAMSAARVEVDFVDAIHDGAPEQLATDRRALRQKFKAGLLDQRSYQSQLAALRKRRLWYHMDREATLKRALARFPAAYAEWFGTFEKLAQSDQRRREEEVE